jgi:hypothetical protein
MKLHAIAGFSLSFSVIFANLVSFANAQAGSEAREVGRGVVEQLAFDVLLKGEKTEQVVKREGPISLLVTDRSGKHRRSVEEAVADINEAFGYGKLALQWRDQVRTPKDDEIVFLLGSVSDGRQLIERAGVSSPGSFRSGSFRYWYKSHSHQSLTKGLVAIDDSLPDEDISLLARKYLLAVLGFRGSARNLRENESFFSPTRRSGYSKERKTLTEADSLMLRFADRWIAPSMTWNKIRKILDSKWSDSLESFRTPTLGELRNRASDEALEEVTSNPSHTKQAVALSYSAMPTKREAVLACDVVVSMGNGKDATASLRLPKGSKGRIVEELPDKVLLFFGSDRLMHVPKEALYNSGVTAPDEIKVELLKLSDRNERIAANGMLEKRFRLSVNQIQLFRNPDGTKMSPVEAFAQAGVRFPEGSAAALTNPSELMVRTTPTMMALVNAIMDAARSSY